MYIVPRRFMLETKTAPAVKRDKKTETDPANKNTIEK